ncbi:hypothetical protein H5410_014578 [Solanum commersonii]|uniref:Zinc finger PMZ-type domain-containing protein n=1 Tax=Solanum commersonii TaxID=4109 RepID=A0A9J5ZRS7_SOLCO|nr:hypothetical protein H5410_014578 [Solanum commersonii]
MDITIHCSRPILRINVIVRSPIEPANSVNNNDSVENENLGNQPDDSICDHSNDSLADDSMNMYDHSVDVEDQLVDAENFKHFEEIDLQLLLAEAAARKSFDFAIVKRRTKYLKICVLFLINTRELPMILQKVYNDAHHEYWTRHLSENLQVNHHCGDSLYLYYNAAKAYSVEEFNNHIAEFKDKCPEAAVIFEHQVGFEKWSRAQFSDNKYDVMTTNIVESLNAMSINEREYPVEFIFNSIAKRFGESFRERYAYNIIGDDNQFTVLSAGSTSIVNLLEKSCSGREYDLVKIPCAHAMAALRSKHGNEYGISIYEYSSPLYKAETYLLAYSESINGVPIESEWYVPEELLSVHIFSPLVDNKLGRKKRKHVKGVEIFIGNDPISSIHVTRLYDLQEITLAQIGKDSGSSPSSLERLWDFTSVYCFASIMEDEEAGCWRKVSFMEVYDFDRAVYGRQRGTLEKTFSEIDAYRVEVLALWVAYRGYTSIGRT